jgi:hypothetical protein
MHAKATVGSLARQKGAKTKSHGNMLRRGVDLPGSFRFTEYLREGEVSNRWVLRSEEPPDSRIFSKHLRADHGVRRQIHRDALNHARPFTLRPHPLRHGGDARIFDDPAFHKPGATKVLEAWESGYVAEMDTTAVGWAVQRLGAGRDKAGEHLGNLESYKIRERVHVVCKVRHYPASFPL